MVGNNHDSDSIPSRGQRRRGTPQIQITRRTILIGFLFIIIAIIITRNTSRAIMSTMYDYTYAITNNKRTRPSPTGTPLPLHALRPSTATSSRKEQEAQPQRPITVRIPHILLFTYKENLLDERNQKTAKAMNFYKNVQHTIQAYRNAWNEPNATVHFLDNDDCAALIQSATPSLYDPFMKETFGAFKGDLCRLAALYKYGGYYFDIDLEVIEPVLLDDDPSKNISFSSSETPVFGNRIFFNAFMASIPGHAILRNNIQTMLEFYNHTGPCHPEFEGVVGCCTLWQAYYNRTSIAERGRNFLLTEYHLGELGTTNELYPNITKRGRSGPCHYIVHDPKELKAYFYSRIVGSSHCSSRF